MLRARWIVLAPFLPLLLTACSDDSSTAPPVTDPPTWVADIQPIFAEHCVSCHTSPPTNDAPDTFRLDKYNADEGKDDLDGAFEKADKIQRWVVVTRAMPPTADLPESDRTLIDQWVNAGAPRE